jgi:hypothetical protein
LSSPSSASLFPFLSFHHLTLAALIIFFILQIFDFREDSVNLVHYAREVRIFMTAKNIISQDEIVPLLFPKVINLQDHCVIQSITSEEHEYEHVSCNLGRENISESSIRL